MKKRQLLACALAMSTILTSVAPVYAEELIDTQQYESIEETETWMESSDEVFETEMNEDVSYEIQDVLVENADFEDGQKLTVKVVLNTVEGVTKAVLSGYAKEKGADVQYECTSVNETECVFEITYNGTEADDYVLDEFVLYTESEDFSYDLTDYEDLSYTVYGLSGNESAEGIAFFSAEKPMYTGANGNDGKFVVVLDPGHDPKCTDRAQVNGVWEPDLNWRMAEALKEELEKYAGVEVYMNRTWDECPGLADVNDAAKCLERRVLRGVEKNADLVISLHNNALGMGLLQNEARGAFIFVTRYLERQPESKALAETVLSKLETLGLKNNGTQTRYYGDDAKDTYEDGTGWDYYAITRHSTLNNIPSLLIEHAFMDNTEDLKILRNDEKVDAIGRADAQAIVEYYDLKLKTEVEPEEESKPETEEESKTESEGESESESEEESEPESDEESKPESEKNGFQKDSEGNVFYYKENVLYKGELKYEGHWYYFDEENGVMATGWTKHHGKTYYYDSEGRMQYGIQEIDGKKYYFHVVYGTKETGEVKYNGNWYYFDEDGVMATGWTEHHGKTYYYDSEGRMQYGIQEIDGKKYYFHVVNGNKVIGEAKYNGNWYYLDEDGVMATGWTKHHGKTYYYDSEGRMQYGIQEIDGKKYYFHVVYGTKETGEAKYNGNWYYFDKDGVMATGWTEHHGKTYYYDSEGRMQYGIQEIDGKKYYFHSVYGTRVTGEAKYNGNWYYFGEDGVMAKGWTEHHNNKYYYDEQGRMLYGKQEIEGHLYYFDKVTGVLVGAEGWVLEDGAWVYYVDFKEQYRFADLKEAFDWAASAIKYEKIDAAPEGVSHIKWYSDYGFEKKTGNCYVMAATFCHVARLMGYEAYLVEGSVPLVSGNMGPHGWVEIVKDGTVYVCDPNFTYSTKRNGYFITYGTSGTWKYSEFERVE